jgi:hypothetical protein
MMVKKSNDKSKEVQRSVQYAPDIHYNYVIYLSILEALGWDPTTHLYAVYLMNCKYSFEYLQSQDWVTIGRSCGQRATKQRQPPRQSTESTKDRNRVPMKGAGQHRGVQRNRLLSAIDRSEPFRVVTHIFSTILILDSIRWGGNRPNT